MDPQPDYQKLLEFYREVIDLTLNHKVYNISLHDDMAYVSPIDLTKALFQVSNKWWKDASEHKLYKQY